MFHKHYPRGDPRPKNSLEVTLAISEESKCDGTIPTTSEPSFKRQMYNTRCATLHEFHQYCIDSDFLEPLYLDPFYSLTRPYFWRQGLKSDGKCVASPCVCEDCFQVSEHNLWYYERSCRRYSDRIALLPYRFGFGRIANVAELKWLMSCI